MGFIYLVTNRINGKVYVGQTTKTVARRWYEHVYNSRNGNESPLSRSIRKHGEHNFTVEVLASCCELFLDVLEERFIQFFQSYGSGQGYNCTVGGGGVRGFRFSEESRTAMSKIRSGVKKGPNASRGVPKSEEHKARIAAALKGNTNGRHRINTAISDEQKELLRSIRTGTVLTESHRAAISRSLVGNTRTLGKRFTRTPEQIENYRRAALNRSDDHKRKLAEAWARRSA